MSEGDRSRRQSVHETRFRTRFASNYPSHLRLLFMCLKVFIISLITQRSICIRWTIYSRSCGLISIFKIRWHYESCFILFETAENPRLITNTIASEKIQFWRKKENGSGSQFLRILLHWVVRNYFPEMSLHRWITRLKILLYKIKSWL